MSKHLTIAQASPRKGFDAFRSYALSPLGQSNDRIAEARERILGAGNKKQQFAAYCDFYLGDNAPVQDSQSELEALKARIAELEGRKPSVAQRIAERVTGESTRTRKPAGDKPRTWNAFWVAKKGLPTKVGATFTYTSKKYGTTSKHKVVSVAKDGSITTQRVSIAR